MIKVNGLPSLGMNSYVMKNILPTAILLILMMVFCLCQSRKDHAVLSASKPGDELKFTLNYNAISNMILERANVQPGERILLIAKRGEFDSLAILLKEKIAQGRGEYLGTVNVNTDPREADTKFVLSARGKSRAALAQHFENVDLGVMLPGVDTTHEPYAAMQDVLRRGRGRTIHFHWSGAYQMNGATLARSQMVDELYQTALLQTDYKKLSEHQSRFEKAARRGRIRVTTPIGTDIHFSIGNRPVTKQNGDASELRSNQAINLIDREVELPAGAVRVAPLEETVQGKIAFPDIEWGSVTVKGLVITFKDGKAVDIYATAGLDQVEAEFQNAGPGASSFRELAVGFNPWLAVPNIGPQWIPYYGYGAGMIRLSLGDNSELGGKVKGGYVRWNFFIDATLEVGDEVWIEGGRIIYALE
jgi:leucyl aminopeptidase (aminopeptidase T)